MQQQDEIRGGLAPEELARARAFVNSIRWQFARSVPQYPHWYSVPAWATDADERAWFVRLIGRHGYKGQALGATWTYLELGDGYRYWCSKQWHAEEGDRRPMLNRALLDEPTQLALDTEVEQ